LVYSHGIGVKRAASLSQFDQAEFDAILPTRSVIEIGANSGR
jgi:hypothetical protein